MKQLNTIKIIFIHGNGGSTPHDHWFSWLKTELESAGIPVIARQFPDAYLARAQYWLPFLKNELKADEQTILIGHSSGALAAMRYAEKNRILGCVLVAAMHTDLGIDTEKLSGYFDQPWQWDAIAANQDWIIQFASHDDPWIPIDEPRFVQTKLNSEYYEFYDEGHFGNDRNKRTFPELLKAVMQKLKA